CAQMSASGLNLNRRPRNGLTPSKLRRLLVISVAMVLLLSAGPSAGQNEIIPRDMYRDNLRRQGDGISFCYNAEGMMAGFEQALARELGRALLLNATLVPISIYSATTQPLDYRLPLLEEQIFLFLAEECDAFMGFVLSPSTPSWLVISRPYLSTETVLATKSQNYRSMSDIPIDRPLGTRGVSLEDNQLLLYLQTLPESRRWRRFPFFNNQILLDKLADGTVAAALIWKPALIFATAGDSDARGLRIISNLPFAIPPLEIGVGLRTQDAYLSTSLGQAIDFLRADGTVDRLMKEHHLAPVAGAPTVK
ncbi:MAG: ABC transporter substrate-binding protein, partial [Micropepsaceae bacterium]